MSATIKPLSYLQRPRNPRGLESYLATPRLRAFARLETKFGECLEIAEVLCPGCRCLRPDSDPKGMPCDARNAQNHIRKLRANKRKKKDNDGENGEDNGEPAKEAEPKAKSKAKAKSKKPKAE